ncbi:MAG: toll/interleukin-1 receptor domain-containing protein [Bacteroidales bacterium]|nr:toll/interleukin-1 receptor domain-containing protein [Bacteroidales bacterium]
MPAKEEQKTNNNSLDLFFSYGHDQNSEIVERIKDDMEKRGHHVWIDTGKIKSGDYWRDDILGGILKASYVVAFLSEHSTRNPGVCLDELKIAVCVKGADIKTVLLESEHNIKLPTTLSEIQWLDMSDWKNVKTLHEPDFDLWYQRKFTELCRAIESNESHELSGDIHFLKNKLTPYLNSEKEYHLLSKGFCGRKWLMVRIKEWQKKYNSKTLIIYGCPGSGKSAFSVNFSHYNPDVFCCFLCEWNKEQTTSPHSLIRTIAFRLATKLPDYRSMLLMQIKENVNLEDMNAETLFEFLLAYPLTHLIDGNRDACIIVVDGLDEAAYNSENFLAEVFSKCVDRLPHWIKFIFTSRPEKNVSKYFRTSETIDIVNDIPAGYDDIKAFFMESLASELYIIPNKLETLNKMCDLSNGVFLYAELLVGDIKSKIIDIQDVCSLPRGLGAFYFVSMKRRFPSIESFLNVREILELLTISDTIPEELIMGVYGYSQYSFITNLDKLGSWVNRFKENDIYILCFSHKSVKDWFSDYNQSCEFYVDCKSGALKLARYCKDIIGMKKENAKITYNDAIFLYVKEHIGIYYVVAERYNELEEFLIQHNCELDPYWNIWNKFPQTWNHTALLNAFLKSDQRHSFLRKLQREGNVTFLYWIFDIIDKKLCYNDFDKEYVSIYMDVVHMSGNYSKAVDIAEKYLQGHMEQFGKEEFFAMLSVRKIHHSMFYKPVNVLLNEAMELLDDMDERFPVVYNELLFLIGGNLGVLYGDWDFCKMWLDKSSGFAHKHHLYDFDKRNARKLADYYCYVGDYERAEKILMKYIPADISISGRYEAYLVGALANLYTCNGNDDKAIECYECLLKYTMSKGIVGWWAHSYLGIANVNYKIGNIKECQVFIRKALEIYGRIKHQWGIIMCEALDSACNSLSKISCEKALQHAKNMSYGSCISSIENLCENNENYLKLFFL